jgi:hypothetical protein
MDEEMEAAAVYLKQSRDESTGAAKSRNDVMVAHWNRLIHSGALEGS